MQEFKTGGYCPSCLHSKNECTCLQQQLNRITSASNGAKPLVSGALPFAELGDFVDWVRDNDWKMYDEGWCELGGSNGWHCTTDELIQMFRDRGNDR